MRKFTAAIAVLLAGTSMMAASETTLSGAAESGDHAAVVREAQEAAAALRTKANWPR